MDFVNKGEGWELQYGAHDGNFINRNETFVFKKNQSDGLEKVYYLDLDSELQKTKLLYYVSTEAERALEDFDPNIFETETDFLLNRPDFSLANRNRLLERFDSWIVMS